MDYTDPFDIIEHLMIGSEGTLGFISEIVYRTVVEHPHKATALMVFPEMEGACTAAAALKSGPVQAVELMDRASLRSVEQKAGMPATLRGLSPEAAALLVETRAGRPGELDANIRDIGRTLKGIPTVFPVAFTRYPAEFARLWDIRKGLFPAVGAVRPIGTAVVIEDVVFPIEVLAPATLELQRLMARHRYHEAIIFGHALEGNLHFVFTQDFAVPAEVDRYRRFMDAVCDMVVGRYDGSLKGEHGTGRNMAPYVEMEWGAEAYRIMKRIKAIFDPKHLLNPGVILNDDPHAHVRALKPMPRTHAVVDRCIECGFCEATCPSGGLTLTPRQRIAARREMSRLERTGADPARLARLTADYVYQGEQTCAADGLCGLSCPVEIDTGELTKALRGVAVSNPALQHRADLAVRHFQAASRLVRLALAGADGLHGLMGVRAVERLSAAARKASGNRLPLWNRCMPTRSPPVRRKASTGAPRGKVVYFPSCIVRTMGPARGDPVAEPLPTAFQRLLARAGFEVVFPEPLASLCCGMPFESKGFHRQADAMAGGLNQALVAGL